MNIKDTCETNDQSITNEDLNVQNAEAIQGGNRGSVPTGSVTFFDNTY